LTDVRALAVALLLGCGSKAPAARPAPAPVERTDACAMPALIAAGEKREADEEVDRLVVYDRTGKRLWVGPDGSGEIPAVWSPDGRLLAYVVGHDLVVHAAGRADRLCSGVITEAGRSPADRSSRYLAARTEAGVVVAVGHRAWCPDGCHRDRLRADDLRWRPGADELWALCGRVAHDHIGTGPAAACAAWRPAATALLGWRTQAPPACWSAGDVPALLGADGTLLALPEPPAAALGHVVAAAAGLLVSDMDDDDGAGGPWLARGARGAWPWLRGDLRAVDRDGAWAASSCRNSDGEAGESLAPRRARVTVIALGEMAGNW
jgi:hypothetical protein